MADAVFFCWVNRDKASTATPVALEALVLPLAIRIGADSRGLCREGSPATAAGPSKRQGTCSVLELSEEGTVVALGIVGTVGVVVVDDGKGDVAELLVELWF